MNGAEPALRPWLALTLMLLVQTLASVAQGVPAVMAPVIAPAVGVRTEQIGVFTGVIYVVAMMSGLYCSRFVRSYGPIRFCRIALVACAVGMALIAVGQPIILLLCAALVGAGYGLANPTAALILGVHAPVNRRGLIFSIKQTGVPLGIALAGLVTPWLYLQFGWQTTVLVWAGIFLIAAAGLSFFVSEFDRFAHESDPKTGHGLGVMFSPLLAVLRDPRLRRLGLVSLVYAATQVCLMAFLVVFLNLELGLSLAVSASVLAAGQLASIIGRPFWGWVADRWGQPARLLGCLGVAMGIACLLLSSLPAETPLWQIYAASLLCAGTAIAWNGVFYAELVRAAPSDALATVTGGTQFMTFAGGMMGPVLFGSIVSLSGHYWLAFALLAVLPVLAGISLLAQPRQ